MFHDNHHVVRYGKEICTCAIQYAVRVTGTLIDSQEATIPAIPCRP